jgi:hypothetical protein
MRTDTFWLMAEDNAALGALRVAGAAVVTSYCLDDALGQFKRWGLLCGRFDLLKESISAKKREARTTADKKRGRL